MFNLIDRYIMSNFLVAIGLSIFALAGIFWLGQSVGLIDEIVLRGESLGTFLNLSLKLFPRILLNVIPVAALAAALIAMNNMANHSELVVMSATGMRPLRLVRPIALIGLCLTVILYLLAMYIAPSTSVELRRSLREIETSYTNNVILSGRFVFPVENVTVFAGDSILSGEMVDLFIEDRREEPIVRTYFAQKGIYRRDGDMMMLALIDGEYHENNIDTGAVSRAKFDKTAINIVQVLPNQDEIKPWREETPNDELFGYINTEKQVFYISEIVYRVFYPLLGFTLPLIAVLIFIMAPFSRHGYGRATSLATFVGLALTAQQLALPSMSVSNIYFAYLGFLPLVLLVIVYIIAIRRGC